MPCPILRHFWRDSAAKLPLTSGHTYVTYGPMLNCATQVLFEGVPTYPEVDRFWKVCEKYKA